MSIDVEETAVPPVIEVRDGFRWRLIPSAVFIFFGGLLLTFVSVVLLALLMGKFLDAQLFLGPGNPELSAQSLSGMMLLFGAGVAWIVGGKLIWRRKYLVGLLVVALTYPLGTTGVLRMFSSPPVTLDYSPAPTPTTTPAQPNQPPPPQFENPRRRTMPKLAAIPFNSNGAEVGLIEAVLA